MRKRVLELGAVVMLTTALPLYLCGQKKHAAGHELIGTLMIVALLATACGNASASGKNAVDLTVSIQTSGGGGYAGNVFVDGVGDTDIKPTGEDSVLHFNAAPDARVTGTITRVNEVGTVHVVVSADKRVVFEDTATDANRSVNIVIQTLKGGE
jgi:hypothetical protein